MLRPSYSELMNVINEGRDIDNEITSRYIIVIAASKRARMLIDGATPLTTHENDKPVSIAVKELNEKKILINLPKEVKEEN